MASRFPALRTAIEAERSYWTPEEVPGEIVLGNVFRPHLETLLEEPAAHSDEIVAAFEFIEEMASSPDPIVEGLSIASVLEGLEDRPKLLHKARRWMGPATQEKIPTFEWLKKHHRCLGTDLDPRD